MNYRKFSLLIFLIFLFRFYSQETTVTVYLYDNTNCLGDPLENSITVITDECFYGRNATSGEPLPGFVVNTTNTADIFDVEVCNDGHCLDCEPFFGISAESCYVLGGTNQSLFLMNFQPITNEGNASSLDIKEIILIKTIIFTFLLHYLFF